MKKTPLQQLIDRLETRILKEEVSHDKYQAYKAAKAMATELLEEEKAMVIDAFDNGAQEQDDWYSNPHGGTKTSEQYFNETFTTNDN